MKRTPETSENTEVSPAESVFRPRSPCTGHVSRTGCVAGEEGVVCQCTSIYSISSQFPRKPASSHHSPLVSVLHIGIGLCLSIALHPRPLFLMTLTIGPCPCSRGP